MEEDVGLKGKVTRLRRRLSIEKADDVSSPSTPTIKRSGRLAAKPQLELINEDAQINSPKKSRRKSVADPEEKPITPSRRSTRIKSNTSIVSETASQITDSPRARRALRRNSQAGSDNEGPATPARQTRRTRKDSASSVENQEPVPSKPLPVVEMVIAEEPETETASKSKSSPELVGEELSPNSIRKSKRLLEKRNRRSGSYKTDRDLSTSSVENISAKDNSDLKIKSIDHVQSQNPLNKSGESKERREQLSESDISLLKTLDGEHKVNTSNHNKSVPSLSDKRNRTKSWPLVLTFPANDNIMFSDNEQSKKKKVKSGNNYSWTSDSGSIRNRTSTKEDKNKGTRDDNEDLKTLIESPSKRKKSKSETFISKEEEKSFEPDEVAEKITSKEETLTKNTTEEPDDKNVTHYIKDCSDGADNTSQKSDNSGIPSEMATFFAKAPSNVQAVLYFEDSDLNSINITTNNTQQLDSEDQCVPVVKHDIKSQEKSSPATTLTPNEQENIFTPKPIIEKESCDNMDSQVNDVNNSCEPMDIDETIHEEILQISKHSLQTSIVERKSLSQRNSISEEPNKSKRKSSISANDTSKIENKSTLILSQSKDLSKTSDNVQSPKPSTNEILSKSTTNIYENTKKGKKAKGNLSLDDLKGTPLKQINVQKLNMQTSTPIATQQIEKTLKTEEKSMSLKNNSSNFSESIDDSDEESCQKSNLINDCAEEASDDYESGDSRDEEERQYEKEHEIVEQGETLRSEEYLTNDSDYEEDSFVVGSDTEDDDLLSGSGDDLSMSDNELSMSKKSKKKYNERKLKEQKNASREMFESRHKINNSEKKSPAPKTKSNRMRIDSSLLESDEEIVVKPKKSKRLRLDSSLDASNKNEDINESHNKSNKKSHKSLQKSVCDESAIKEEEITICHENENDKDDPLHVLFKQEPKTPHKDLDMSVVQFTSRQDIENVDVCEGKSILNQTGKDPLEDTIANEDVSDSENEEIIQNYDSILENLNKNKKSNLNSNNLSLKLDNKSKKGKNEPILDQLNLTHSKRSKKVAKQQLQNVVHSKTPEISKEKRDSDNLSDSNSIDLKLSYSEDSCEKGDNKNTNKEKLSKEEEMFVPLQKSTGKTNIRESGDDLFFIDTTGAKDNEKDDDQEDGPVEILFTSKNKKKKNKLDASLNKTETNESTQPEETAGAKKKKQKKKHSAALDQSDDLFFLDTTGAKDTEKNDDQEDGPVEILFTSKNKKKKNKLDASLNKTETNESTQPEETAGAKKKKQKKKHSAALDQSGEGTIIMEDSSSKRKHSDTGKAQNLVVEAIHDNDSDDAPIEAPYQSEKASDLPGNSQNSDNTPPAEDGESKKKKKKKKKKQSAVSDQSDLNDVGFDGAPKETPYQNVRDTYLEANLQESETTEPAQLGSGKKEKKKKKKQGATSEQADDSPLIEHDFDLKSNKRKRKSAKTEDSVDEEGPQENVENEELNESSSIGRQKKKRKISQENVAIDEIDVQVEGGKKKKKKNREINFQDIVPETETTQTQIKKNKKRKERDEDADSKNSKISKGNSLDEVHMPPLPDNILSQLDDKPRKVTGTSKVISTSNFAVENAKQRRAKPSTYLEESIYLDAISPPAKKDKSRLKKPKVLPFIPTASISDSGFTTNFQIKKIPQNVEFVGGPAEMTFSKETYLQQKGIKRLGTYEHYKKQISRKLCKF